MTISLIEPDYWQSAIWQPSYNPIPPLPSIPPGFDDPFCTTEKNNDRNYSSCNPIDEWVKYISRYIMTAPCNAEAA